MTSSLVFSIFFCMFSTLLEFVCSKIQFSPFTTDRLPNCGGQVAVLMLPTFASTYIRVGWPRKLHVPATLGEIFARTSDSKKSLQGPATLGVISCKEL
jgi:hypothetical protein